MVFKVQVHDGMVSLASQVKAVDDRSRVCVEDLAVSQARADLAPLSLFNQPSCKNNLLRAVLQ